MRELMCEIINTIKNIHLNMTRITRTMECYISIYSYISEDS